MGQLHVQVIGTFTRETAVDRVWFSVESYHRF